MKRGIPWSLCVLGIVAAGAAFAHDEKDAASSHATHHEDQLEFGRVGKGADVKRRIVVEMKDQFAFVPSKLHVKSGETVRLVIRNTGAMVHEWILGTSQEIEEHAELMRRFPNMEHDEPQQVRVPPGEVRELVWQFNRPGTFAFGCLQPGHYEAGMKGTVEVK
jgi:uncharacterized cupredoxin-like copper-binding protein